KIFAALPKNTKLRDPAPETLKFASEAFASMPLEQLKNVFLFRELYGTPDDSNPEYFQVLFGFLQRQKGGPKERPDRQERCTEAVEDTFGMELDAELIPILFPKFPSDRMEKVAERVRASIVSGLEKNTWLSQTAKAEAIRKVSKADLMLVQPKREIDWHFLPVMTYDVTKPLTNQKRALQAQIDRELREVKSKRNRREWSMSPLTVNAYYSPTNNQFVLPLGILQFPVFDPKMSDVENLGAIGVIVGHELGHGIDDSGSKYDHQGRVRNWKTAEDKKDFDARAQKFVDLFNGYGHNGELTLGENIGDHEGVTFAFDAAFPDASKAKPEDVQKFFTA
ncbi:MAG: M13 family peptidase, partial [Proteobacteria bacterium]